MPRFSGTLVDEDTKPRFGGTPVDAKPRFGGTPVEDTAQPQTLQSNVASRFDQFRQENPQVAGMQDSLVGNEPSFVQQQRQYPEGTISAPKPFDWLTRRASMATEYAKGTGDLAMEGRDYMAAEPFRRKVRSGEIDGGVVDFFQQGAWDTIQNNRAASASASRDELKMIQSEDREIRGALGDKMNLGDASFGGKVVKGGAQSAFPMLESMFLSGTASATPGVGPVAGKAVAGTYWQQQGAGQFMRAFLQDKDIDSFSDEELQQMNTISQAMGVPYAAIEFAVSSIPGMKSLGSSVDRQIANAVVRKMMSNPTLIRRVAEEGVAFGVRAAIESLVEESGQGAVDATTQEMLSRVESGDVGALMEYDWGKIFKEGARQGVESIPAVLGITAVGGAPGAIKNIATTEDVPFDPALDQAAIDALSPRNAQLTVVDGSTVPNRPDVVAQAEEAPENTKQAGQPVTTPEGRPVTIEQSETIDDRGQPISTGQPLEADTPPQSAAVLSPPTAPPSAEAVRAEPSTKEQSSLPAAEEATKGAPQAPSDESAASSSAATEEFPVEARPAGGEVAGKIETLAGEAYEQEASLPVDVPVDEMNRTELQHEARNLGISHRGSKNAIKRRILNARKSSRERARQFLQTVQEDQSIPKELVESLADVAPQTYQQTRTSEIFTHFREWLDKGASNVTQAEEFVNSKESPSAAKGAMFAALLDKYQHDGNYDAESALVEEYDTQLRESGRFVQAASLFSQMSGRGFMKHVQKFLDRHNVTVKEDVLDDIRRQYVDASRIENAQERSEAMGAVVEQVANMAPAGWKDWIHAYRYTNMLSNPRSHERNIFGNAATTYIARPASLVGQGRLIGAGRYLGTALKSLPDGARAFMEAWRSGSTASRWYEALNSYGSQFESERMRQSARESKLRRSLLVIGRLLEAQDKFFSALIANGESARLMQEGVSEDIAVQRGNELAENLLYRERIGSDMSDRDAALGVRALDAAGHLIEQARNVPFVGRAAGWFIPFVRTPINIGKRMVEFSPLGYIRAPGSQKMSIETIGRANAGTAVVFMGAVMAALGRTTGEAPKDKEERRLWYDSGRRPWSVLIGDKWIPMWYLGPFAGALALPAAFRDSWVDNSELAGEGYIKKSTVAIAGLADFYASQTPLQGVKTFMDLMSGDSDYNSESALAFTAGQFVPASGFLRWANQLVFDPVYRRPGYFIDSLKKDYPWFSKQTLPYLDSEGNPVVRNRKSSLLPFDYGTVRGDMEQQRAQRNALVTIRRQNDKVIDGMVRGVLNDSISINALFDEMYNLADLTSDPRAEFTRLRGRARNKIAARGKDPDEYIPRKSSSGRATRPRRR